MNESYEVILADQALSTIVDFDNLKAENTNFLSKIFRAALCQKEDKEKVIAKFEAGDHFKYFAEYFLGFTKYDKYLSAAIIEREYYSEDFISDYSNWHSKSFSSQGARCVRIHFFCGSCENFSIANLSESLKSSTNSAFLQNDYLGYTIIKPIKKRFIGKTVLLPYPKLTENSTDKRIFWAMRLYQINLFGKLLQIDSIAFQEQDKSVAACSTASLWSVLNFTLGDSNIVNQNYSASEITKKAGFSGKQGRIFPHKKGLNLEQILRVINSYGFTSQQYAINHEVNEEYLLPERVKQVVFAYSRLKNPILIITDPFDSNERTVGIKHSNVIVGFKVSYNSEGSKSKDNIINPGYGFITQLYVHDDQFGPFVRLEFLTEDEIEKLNSLDTKQNVENLLSELKIDRSVIDVIISNLANGEGQNVMNELLPLLEKVDNNSIDVRDLNNKLSRYVEFFSKNNSPNRFLTKSVWDAKHPEKRPDTKINAIIIPISEKITISLDEITPQASIYNSILFPYINANIRKGKIYFDLNIWLNNDYKKDLIERHESNNITPFLTKNIPRFIWVCKLYSVDERSKTHYFDIVFDATDLNDDIYVVDILQYTDFEWKFSDFVSSYRSQKGSNRVFNLEEVEIIKSKID